MGNYSKEVTILYVEDDDDIREGYAKALRRVSKELITAQNGEIGLQKYKEFLPDIIVSDIKMPAMNGIDMLKAIKEINPHANIVFTTAHSESAYLLEAIELQVDGYLLKPVQKKALLDIVEKVAKQISLEKENIEQRNILQHIIDSENSLSLITDVSKISFASKSFLSIFGLDTIEDLTTKNMSILDILNDENSSINKKSIVESMNKNENLYEFINGISETDRVITLKHGNIDEKSYYLNISKITEMNFLINLTDITEIEKQREETTKKAYKDGLTGVYNRNKFEEVFEYEYKRSRRYKYPICIAMLDIDHFKEFNDKFGHLIGDEVLIMLANEVDEHTRDTDLFARWGGEEFVILFTNISLESAKAKANDIRKHIQSLEHKTAGSVTASFGVAEIKEDDTMKSLLNRADEALYEAKESGRNCVIAKS